MGLKTRTCADACKQFEKKFSSLRCHTENLITKDEDEHFTLDFFVFVAVFYAAHTLMKCFVLDLNLGLVLYYISPSLICSCHVMLESNSALCLSFLLLQNRLNYTYFPSSQNKVMSRL